MIQYLNKELTDLKRPIAPSRTALNTTSKYGAVSPIRQSYDNPGMSSTKYVNPERLAKYQTDDYNPSYTGPSASFGGARTQTAYGYDKSAAKDRDFDNYLGGGEKVNFFKKCL